MLVLHRPLIRCTACSYAAPPAHTLHRPLIRCTARSYAAPHAHTLHRPLIRCTARSYAAPHAHTLHRTLVRCTGRSYAAPHTCTLHRTLVRCTAHSYGAPHAHTLQQRGQQHPAHPAYRGGRADMLGLIQKLPVSLSLLPSPLSLPLSTFTPLQLPKGKECLLTDTVGFIQLPPQLPLSLFQLIPPLHYTPLPLCPPATQRQGVSVDGHSGVHSTPPSAPSLLVSAHPPSSLHTPSPHPPAAQRQGVSVDGHSGVHSEASHPAGERTER
ncbi:unnamed protein product [Closterium sp. NIES-53]